jgi:hypoxanthine-DNA glycosylase
MTIKHSFAPVVDNRTRVLILGSLPGEVSLAERRYYANPSNQFWRLTSAVIGQNLAAMEYDARLSALRDTGIGLWDSIGSAKRSGSLDTAIRDHTPNALRELVASLPALQVVGFNGGTSARIGRRQLGDVDRNLIDLPSSSAAYCAISFEAKRARWMTLLPFLDIRAGRLQR